MGGRPGLPREAIEAGGAGAAWRGGRALRPPATTFFVSARAPTPTRAHPARSRALKL